MIIGLSLAAERSNAHNILQEDTQHLMPVLKSFLASLRDICILLDEEEKATGRITVHTCTSACIHPRSAYAVMHAYMPTDALRLFRRHTPPPSVTLRDNYNTIKCDAVFLPYLLCCSPVSCSSGTRCAFGQVCKNSARLLFMWALAGGKRGEGGIGSEEECRCEMRARLRASERERPSELERAKDQRKEGGGRERSCTDGSRSDQMSGGSEIETCARI